MCTPESTLPCAPELESELESESTPELPESERSAPPELLAMPAVEVDRA